MNHKQLLKGYRLLLGRKLTTGTIGLVLLLTALPVPPLTAQSPVGARVLESSSHRLTFEVAFDHANTAALLKTAKSATDSGSRSADGLRRSFLVVLPPDGAVKMRASYSGVSPVASPDSSLVRHLNREFVQWKEIGLWRGFRLARVEVQAVGREPGNGWQAISSATVQLSFENAPMESPAPLLPEERSFIEKAINAEMATYWRKKSDRKRQAAVRRQAEKAPAVKIFVHRDGMVRVTLQAVLDAGLSVTDVPVSRVHISHRGVAIPVFWEEDGDGLWEPGEAVWFWGERPRGDSTWYNEETAANVYWLSLKESTATGFRAVPAAPNAPAVTVDSVWQWRHFEQNRSYYNGDDEADIFTTDRIPGEGWIWKRLMGGEELETTVNWPAPATGAPPGSLRVRVRGITRTSIKPNHHVRIRLNDVSVADTLFSDNADVLIEAAVPADRLRDGQNRIQIQNVGDTGAPIDQIYVDWFEIGGWRRLRWTDSVLTMEAQPLPDGGRQRFHVRGMPGAPFWIFDLTLGRYLQPDSVWQDAQEVRHLLFSDTLSAPRRYLILTQEGLLRPDSLRLDSPSQWRSPERQADMIIVSHADFLPAADRLAEFKRRHSGLRVAVVDVEDIYDEFNSGIVSVNALRRFFEYAYRQWQKPEPRYVLLVGDGTWDPRRFSPFSRKRNFIPVYGNPVSDSRLVCVDGPDDFLPDMFIGRLPVETLAEADAMVDKIIQYETQPLPDWSKQFVFLNGGINAYEQGLFYRQSERLIERFVEPPPVAGRVQRIYKTTEGRIRGERLPEILQAIDAGCMLFTFSGHAGSRTWELMMVNEDIPRLQNRQKLPFIASMTCHTARFANPEQNSFGEDFVRLPERGAVAFWSTSGWGFVYQDGILLDGLFQAVARDSIREVGVITTLAKLHLWMQLGSLPVNRNLIDQYTLLGDPSLKLALPTRPDLAIRSTDLATRPEAPTEQDSVVQIQVRLRNRGLVPRDSVAVRVQVASDQGGGQTWQFRMPPVGFQDSLRFTWNARFRQTPARLTAVLDPQNQIVEVDETNNRAERVILFRRLNFSLADPRPWAVISEPRPVLRIYNPPVASATPRQFLFEIDTTSSFDSEWKMRSDPVAEQTVRTEWRVPRPLAPRLYFWRVREIASPDGDWQSAAFYVDTTTAGAGFRQQSPNWALAEGAFQPVGDGIALPADSSRSLSFAVQSAGSQDGNRCLITVQGLRINGSGNGLHIVAYDPIARKVLGEPQVFSAEDSGRAAEAAAFLRGLPQGALLLAGVQGDAVQLVTPELVLAFREWGSRQFEHVQAQNGWAFIGMRGLTSPLAEARKRPGSGEASAAFRLLPFQIRSSVTSPVIGPAVRWHTAWWRRGKEWVRLPGSAPGSVEVVLWGGRTRYGPWQALIPSAGNNEALKHIDADDFPYVRLQAELRDDDGMNSPVLAAWQVTFDPAGDLIVDAPNVTFSSDSVYPGEAIEVNVPVINLGAYAVDSVRLVLRDAQIDARVHDEKTLSLSPGKLQNVTLTWIEQRPGTYSVEVALDPDDRFPEPVESNNLLLHRFTVLKDSIAPEIRVLFDGRIAADEAFVNASPRIVCEIYDQSPIAVQDTSDIQLILDNVPLSFTGSPWPVSFQPIRDGSRKRAVLQFQPQLDPGNHALQIVVQDRLGYMAEKRIEFIVSDKIAIRNAINFPNPFRDQTAFTFDLTASAEHGIIKIFTLSGRLIHSIEFTPRVGYNQIQWDGRDQLGEPLANGVYLYKIAVRRGDQQVETIQKLAIAR